MSNAQPRRLNSLFGSRAKKERRPTGISRRRRAAFSFETLEPRQVMSASPIVQPFQLTDPGDTSSATAQDMEALYASLSAEQRETLDRELWWYQQMAMPFTGMGVKSVPNDPYFQNQWHLLNTGQNVGGQDFQPILGVPGEDINVVGAWNLGYTGAGVNVAVLDSGVQLNHPDLVDNIDLGRSFDALTQSGNGNPIFSLLNPIAAHGTAVAGLIGAVGNNGIGGVGVAPGVSLSSVRLIDFGQTEQAFVDAFRSTVFNGVDITNNSWGPSVGRGLAGPTASMMLALRDSVLFGRDGKGVIHVFASGNDGGPTFNEGWLPIGGYNTSSYNGWINSRYTIGVTGVDHDGFYNNVDGTITGYPEISPGVLVAAPTGSNAGLVITNETGLGSGLWTTDLTGHFGFNVAPDPNGDETLDPFFPFDRDFLEDPDYTSRMNGTSAAAPLVSGVIALMLEANPELTWRDVQEILVRSARQNAPLGIPQDGQGNATQSTWIVNQVPIFHDIDFTGVVTNAVQQTLFPTLDPNWQFGIINGVAGSFHPDHHVGTPFTMTNGAGYTVSQGVGSHGEWIGYGHGVVDAELAVRLAEQWHTKNQALPPEQTFTSFVQAQGWNLPAAEQGNMRTGWQLVPGGIGGRSGFISLWNEHFADDPNFDQVFPYRGDSSVELNVPAGQTMSLENIEVKISVGGGTAEALNHLRVLLVSPDGTHSDLNNYWYRPTAVAPIIQAGSVSNALPPQGEAGSVDTTPGQNLVWTFKSVRHWGERTDDAIVYDPVTGMPAIDQSGIFQTPQIDPATGDFIFEPGKAMTQGWRVVIENWGDTTLALGGIEIAWHGRPVEAASERITGSIGIDENDNDLFNFSRMILQSTGTQFGDVFAVPDLTQEQFAANVTVIARRASDNEIVGRFVTGDDGNFYFDLVPDEYVISIEDPEGRAVLDDSLTPDGLLDHYKAEWHIGLEHFKVHQKQAGTPGETLVDANGAPIPWLDANGEEQVTGVRGINFLLDAGPAQSEEVSFSGTVYADTNGDGVFNANDVALPNATVYVDLNRNGALDSGEVSTQTDVNGNYTLVQTGVTAAAAMNVGIVAPTQWTNEGPEDGLHELLVVGGETYGNLDFYIDPPADNIGGGGASLTGYLLGTVFEDVNGDGIRNGAEVASPSITVYIDANNNGVLDASEASTDTNQNGAYAFGGVAPGQHQVRIDIASPIVQTTPAAGQPWVVILTGSSTISTLHFGIRDLAVNDYGDLPSSYEQRPLAGGGSVLDPAHHKKSGYWIGGGVDGELTNNPTPGANGDDLAVVDVGNDENGISFTFLNGVLQITATANTYTGYLQGWIDWNNDGDFLDAGERVVTDALLVAGQNVLQINVPEGVGAGDVYARFRYGEHSHNPQTGLPRAIDTPWGFAATGEVEDYRLAVPPPAGPILVNVAADFDRDEDVDGNDFLMWQRGVGKTDAVKADGNTDADGDVDGADLNRWETSYGLSLGGGLGESSSGSSTAVPAGAGNAFNPNAGSGSISTSISTDLGGQLGGVAESLLAASRPMVTRLSGVARNAGAGENVVQTVSQKLVASSYDWVRRDRALDDLFGLAGDETGADELELELTDAQCDEAFAAFAE